ncbi:aminomethyl-transferring glycine dehydrogenase subunit GcvPA [Pullulanibacillus sp. KACC 23026]|uniref:aminomethyl-transferring glycine dehydrogenase subunit GcvPA n=1 Tax=Pullulanibacillus sp. KACC 23026 TaxID=3028315 RepID=UPI0023B1A1A0|nr:aminomethyl-transferring glycine dehydrogenase subunit GcvPA [Pullulanibacillus sp. KACC 23026]WEG14298.1 aminomethyl-transferring glycine dehydrogenase subunit GcvPA [Pullulanibacillus sp. KACC 23026]
MGTFRYLPVTDQDRQDMLKVIGVESVDDLFSDVPEKVRFKGRLEVEEALSEGDLFKFMSSLAAKNVNTKETPSFLGAGVYDHYIPSIVNHVISRSEFYTAYTPYQPEISQGELQAIFEFQSMICELTGMQVANSSMYDGQTALAEAALLSVNVSRQTKIIVSEGVHPEARQVLATYAKGQNLEVIEVGLANGVTDLEQLKTVLNDETACVIVQYPNFFGQIEPVKEIEALTHAAKKAQLVVSSNPLALGLLTAPGELGADIVIGDCQSLGIPASFGGPHCGYFATTEKLMRKVPGRLVGETIDENGTRGYVLTLQAREQHIRRDKATSNICSNQALNALASSVCMTALGKTGIKEIAYQNLQKAHYAVNQFKAIGIEPVHNGAYFNEFVINTGRPVKEVNRELLKAGFIGGVDLGRFDESWDQLMLIAVTEQRNKQEIDQFVNVLGGLIRG